VDNAALQKAVFFGIIKVPINHMKRVADIMSKEVVTVAPDTKIAEVAEILFKNRFHGVPVLEDGKIVGIITETDFFTKDVANLFLPSYITFLKENRIVDELPADKKEEVRKLLNIRARDIMSPNCVSILKDMDLNALLEFFKSTKFYTLPVVDETEAMVGIVTQSDVVGLIKGKEL
jgi:CBS-domain-containing membrane protein